MSDSSIGFASWKVLGKNTGFGDWWTSPTPSLTGYVIFGKSPPFWVPVFSLVEWGSINLTVWVIQEADTKMALDMPDVPWRRLWREKRRGSRCKQGRSPDPSAGQTSESRAGRSVSRRSLRPWCGWEKVLPRSVGCPRTKAAHYRGHNKQPHMTVSRKWQLSHVFIFWGGSGIWSVLSWVLFLFHVQSIRVCLSLGCCEKAP